MDNTTKWSATHTGKKNKCMQGRIVYQSDSAGASPRHCGLSEMGGKLPCSDSALLRNVPSCIPSSLMSFWMFGLLRWCLPGSCSAVLEFIPLLVPIDSLTSLGFVLLWSTKSTRFRFFGRRFFSHQRSCNM